MELRVPLVDNYLQLGYHSKCKELDAVIDEDENNYIYVTLLCNQKHILKTLTVKPNLAINIKYNEWLRSRSYYLSPNIFAYFDKEKLVIADEKGVIDEYKASSIIKYVFNPHERIGAIIFTDTGFLRRKKYVIVGFNDDSYNIFESPLIDIIHYANGFIIAYKDDRHIILEKIPYGTRNTFDIHTDNLNLYRYKNLLSIAYDEGSLIINAKNMEILYHTPNRDIIPLGAINDTIVYWNHKFHTITIRKMTQNPKGKEITLICKSRPILAGILGEKILISCSNGIIEVKDHNWRLHDISRKILGKKLISATVIEESLIAGISNEIIVWGKEKYYFHVASLLDATKCFDKYLMVIDEKGIGIVDVNESIDNIVLYESLELDENLRLRKRIEFNKKVIVSNTISHNNRVIEKRHNIFDIILVDDKPVIFDILYYGTYRVRDDNNSININFEILDAEVTDYTYKNSRKILGIKYKYINPLNEDILKPIVIVGNKDIIGYIRLKKRSSGQGLIQIPIRDEKRFNFIKIGNTVVPVNKRVVGGPHYSINKSSIDVVNQSIVLNIKVLASKVVDDDDLYVCVRGLLNGCKKLESPNDIGTSIDVPVTINYSKDYVSISLYKLIETPLGKEIVEYDIKNINVSLNKISLIAVSRKDKLYIIVDDLPSTKDNIVITFDNIIEKHYVMKTPFLLSYVSRRTVEKLCATILQLGKEILYCSRSNVKLYDS